MWPDKARTHVTVGHISCGLPEQAPVAAAGSAVDRLSFQQCGSHWFCMVDLIYLQPDNTVVYPGRVWSLESLRLALLSFQSEQIFDSEPLVCYLV